MTKKRRALNKVDRHNTSRTVSSNRNKPCECGSDKKAKHCCDRGKERSTETVEQGLNRVGSSCRFHAEKAMINVCGIPDMHAPMTNAQRGIIRAAIKVEAELKKAEEEEDADSSLL